LTAPDWTNAGQLAGAAAAEQASNAITPDSESNLLNNIKLISIVNLQAVAGLKADRPLVHGLHGISLPLVEYLNANSILAQIYGGVTSPVFVVAIMPAGIERRHRGSRDYRNIATYLFALLPQGGSGNNDDLMNKRHTSAVADQLSYQRFSVSQIYDICHSRLSSF